MKVEVILQANADPIVREIKTGKEISGVYEVCILPGQKALARVEGGIVLNDEKEAATFEIPVIKISGMWES